MKDVITSLRRTPYQSLATFFALFMTLFLSLAIFFSLSLLYGLLGFVESRPQVTVYFQNQTSESDIQKMKEQLISSGKVTSVKYISKQDAYVIYKNLNKDNPLLLEMVSPDILPASLEIYAKKPVFLPEIADFLKKQSGIDEVNFQKNIIDKLLNLTSIMRKISIIFFVYFIITTVIILIAITHFKIALKKDEIELLRLLGATKWYVQSPFLKEASFFGFFSSLSVFCLFFLILLLGQPFLKSYLTGISQLSIDFSYFTIPIWPMNIEFSALSYIFITLFGMIISWIATLLATQKYIK